MAQSQTKPATPARTHRELFSIGVLLIVFPVLFHALAQFADPTTYLQFFDPIATASVLIAGILTLLLNHWGHYQAAWICIIAGATICGYFTASVEQLGEGYSLTIYIIVSFLALTRLPKHGWKLVTFVCLLAISLQKFLQVRELTSSTDSWNAVISLVVNVFIFAAYVLVMWLLHRHLDVQIKELHHANKTLTKLNADLKHSEDKSRILMETGLDPFFVIQPDGQVLEVNQRACDLLGYSEDELLCQPVKTLAPQGSPDQLQIMFDTMHNLGELKSLRTTLTRKDGSTFEAEVYGRILPLEQNKAMYVAARDITYHLEREQTIRDKSNLLEMITQNLPVRIAYFDNDSKIKFHNRAFADTYQQALDLTNVDANLIMEPTEVSKRRVYVDRAMQGETVTFELEVLLPNGSLRTSQKTYVPHIEDAQVVGIVSLGIDITELRDVQQSLEANNALLDHVVNNMPARISYIDRAGIIQFVNDRVQEHFGINPDDAIGANVHDMLPKSYMQAIEPHVRNAFRSGEQIVFESNFEHADGKQVVERSYYYPNMVDGKVEALFTLHMDITEIRLAEDALAQAQKLESLGILAGGIAHDFNNLLVAILGQSSLALAKIESDHQARRHIVQSVSASNRAAALTQQMLAYSGRGSFTAGLINMNELIESNLNLFAVSIPKNVHLTTNLCSPMPMIDCDPTQMQQLIMNLIINAGQAIGEANGTISITTSVRDISAERGEFWEITGDPLIPGSYVSIEVQDDGSGMDKATINQIFDPFYTTKENGTGLGLAAALGIIRGHKGGVNLYSEVGRGTVFHLLFPVSNDVEEVNIDQKTVSAESVPTISHTVLVIDDEQDILDVVDDMLDLHDIRTLSAANGQAGIDLYRQHVDEISLVLLDLMMPGLSGQDTFLALRDINPDVQVILSSGYNETEATRQFVGRGLVDFIQKPYDFNTLVTRVRAALDGESEALTAVIDAA